MFNGIRVALVVFLVLAGESYAGESEVFVERPPGLINFSYPEFPPKLRSYGWNGKGKFLLKVNPKTGIVDEVKILKGTGHVLFDEFSAKAFFQWRFQPGISQVPVRVEFYTRGYARDLH
jgi:outer membrane biosynthesis protein TonB